MLLLINTWTTLTALFELLVSNDPDRIWAIALWSVVTKSHPVMVATLLAEVFNGFAHFSLDISVLVSVSTRFVKG